MKFALWSFAFLSLAQVAQSKTSNPTLDMGQAKTILVLEEFNVTSNFVANNGRIVIGDTLNDKILVRPIDGTPGLDIAATPQPLFTTNIDANRVAVSDAMNNLVTIYDISSGRKISNYDYFQPAPRFPQHFGPWQITHYDGVIYGADRFDSVDSDGMLYSMLTTYDLASNRPNKTWPAKWITRPSSPNEISQFTGPAHLTAVDDVLYVIERANPANPTDDQLSVFNLKTWKRVDRQAIPGAGKMGNAYEILSHGSEICIIFGTSLSSESYLRCGLPNLSDWGTNDLELGPMAVSMASHGDLLFVLLKGDLDTEGDESIALIRHEKGQAPTLIKEYSLAKISQLKNVRSLDFDAKTSTILIRGQEAIVGIPVIN